MILADRGFNIEDDLRFYGAQLAIPAFTRGKKKNFHWKKLNVHSVYLEYVFMWSISMDY